MSLNEYMDDLALVAPTPEQMTTVLTLARRLWQLQGDIAGIEAELENKKEEMRRVAEADLPEAMLAVGVTEQPLGGGYSIKLTTNYHASIPKDRAAEAFSWLDATGHGDIIKNEVKISFARDQNDYCKTFIEELKARHPNLSPASKAFVHPQTFGAFIREQISKGEDLPRDILGIYERRAAVIVAPKLKSAL